MSLATIDLLLTFIPVKIRARFPTGMHLPDLPSQVLTILQMWDEAIDQISDTLALRTPRKELLFIAELNPEKDDAGNM